MHKRALQALLNEGIHPTRTHIDAGSYIKEGSDIFHAVGILLLLIYF